MENTTSKTKAPGFDFGKIAMWACCIAMPVGAGIYFISLPAESQTFAQLVTLAPLLACGAMHLVLHKFMGKSCHSNNGDERSAGDAAGVKSQQMQSTPVPASERSV